MAAKTLRVVMTVLFLCRLAKSQDQESCDEFTRQPQNVLVNAGQMALIECEYGSRAVRWRKGSTSILDMEDASNPCDCQILSDGDLQFNNASLGDAGDYTCFVLVSHGVTNTCTATLGLAEGPNFSNKMGPGSAESTSRELSVHVAGDPPPHQPPDVVWRHNNNDIATDRVTISSEEDGNGRIERLTITGILPEDRGRYTLHATTAAGEASVGWDVFVLFGTVDMVSANDGNDEETVLTCSGEFYSMGTTSWLRGGQEVAGQETLIMGTYETTFETSLAVPESSCGADSEIVRCQLRHNAVEGEVTASQGYVVCKDCSPPAASATMDASTDGCSTLQVTLTGVLDHYVIEYRPQGTTQLSRENVTMSFTSETFPLKELQEGTIYDIRAVCPDTNSPPPFFSAMTNSKPAPVTGVTVTTDPDGGQTSAKLTWESSSASDVTGYHIMWVSDNGSDHDDVSETSTQFVQAIRCDVSYEYRVAAINPCGKGEFSASVEAMCVTELPAVRVELEELSFKTEGPEGTLSLTFTIANVEQVKSVRVDVLEENDDFELLQTLNYTIEEELYKGGSVCLSGLTPGRQYVVCVRVVYSNMEEDFACSRLTEKEEFVGSTQGSCKLPTSQKVHSVDSSDDGSDGSSGIPDWGIAVIVVSALVLVAVLFCFCGLCCACQTFQSKNVNFGSSSSINTERGGNVMPTNIHMHNPRAVSPTRSCLKYHRDRGHSTTWNDHVDTLRQMETSKGTHV